MSWFQKTLTNIGKILRFLGPVLLLLFTIIDGLGFLDKWHWLEINFAIVGLWLTIVVLEFVMGNHERLEEVRKLAEEIQRGSSNLNREMKQLHFDFIRDRIDALQDSRQTLDPKINSIIGPYVEEHVRALGGVFQESRIELDKKKFLVMYREALATYQGSRIYATSYPSRKYFWNNSETEQAMRLFIDKKGSMTRIFFLDKASQRSEPETETILRRQRQFHVDVHTLVATAVPADWQRVFLVEGEGRIGWELTLSRDLDIEKAVVFWDRNKTQELLDLFDKLWKTDGRTPFTGGAPLDPNRSGGKPDLDRFRQYELHEWERPSVVKAYDRYFGPIVKPAAVQLLKTLAAGVDSSGKRLLDVASGAGYAASAAAAQGMRVVAVDLSASAVALGESLYPDITFRTGDAERLPFGEGEFDFVAANFGVMHFASPEAAFREAYRVLKPGGRFAFTVWSQDSDQEDVLGVVQDVIESLENQDVKPPDGPPFFRFNQGAEATAVLSACGFRDVRLRSQQSTWKLASPRELYEAFAEGSARMGGRIRVQNKEHPSNGAAIRDCLIDRAKMYEVDGGGLQIPMSYTIVTAEKP